MVTYDELSKFIQSMVEQGVIIRIIEHTPTLVRAVRRNRFGAETPVRFEDHGRGFNRMPTGMGDRFEVWRMSPDTPLDLANIDRLTEAVKRKIDILESELSGLKYQLGNLRRLAIVVEEWRDG